jgi:SAM-dependent methyltransferase
MSSRPSRVFRAARCVLEAVAEQEPRLQSEAKSGPRFHDFYEGRYLRQIRYLPGQNRLKDWVFFNLVQSGVMGDLRKVLVPGAVVVDLGCAGGVAWLGREATAIGVDISFASLLEAAKVYRAAVQADVQRLPLSDSSADLVWGSYFFEHLLPEEKDACLQECRRILRPGGALVLQFDVLSNNRMTRFALRDPERFARGFVENDGHVGLEPLPDAIERIRNNGFEVAKVRKFGTTSLQYLATYNWLALGYADTHKWVALLARSTDFLSRSKLGLFYEFAVTAFDRLIDPISKPENASRTIVVATKSQG